MKTTEILTSINAFMGQMREGDTREIIANLQAALDYQTEKLRIYEEKYKAETGKERPELTDDERRSSDRCGNVKIIGMVLRGGAESRKLHFLDIRIIRAAIHGAHHGRLKRLDN